MLILLPPSEGKATPEAGDPVDLGSLAIAEELGPLRNKLLDALEQLGGKPVGRAVKALSISKGQAGEVGVNAALRKAPAATAAQVYSGVLYERLDLAGLPAAARRRAQRQVLIASALWGFVRPDDRIPYYRFSAKARLSRIGPPAVWWRDALAEAMPDKPDELIVDMRSAAYAAAWKPKQATLLSVRAFTEQDGKRKTVSHMAKAVRGEVARALLLAKKAPVTPEAVAAIASDAGFRVELTPSTLDVIVELPGRRD
jgi:cytoplasmic iron level regulating protein YaaA (DUF328/UPF0246 family)